MARKSSHSDPLDLLLDTMTNAFSAIIMIAISVSLLLNDSKKAETPADDPRAEMAQRKAAHRAEEMAGAQKLHAELEEKLRQAGDVAQMVRERDALKEKVASAEAETRMPTTATGTALNDPRAALSRDIMALQESAAKLTSRAEEMGKVAATKQTKQTIEAQPAQRRPRYDQNSLSAGFPAQPTLSLKVAGPNGMERNEGSITWIESGSSAEIEPKEGAGLDPEKNEAAVRDFIASLRKFSGTLKGDSGLYVASYVYKDSFAAYLRFKQLFAAAKTGLGQGWEPVANEENLRFGATGFKPGEQ